MWKVSAESHSGVKLTALMGLHYIHFALENAFYDSYIFGMYVVLSVGLWNFFDGRSKLVRFKMVPP
jgi:hypothetical protein